MIPKNNKERFVKKYGNLWYLRDLDFLVENLAECGYNMTVELMAIAMRSGKRKQWAVYDDYDEAVDASKRVRKALGFPEATYPARDVKTYKYV